jgi:hypothetical protein
MTPPIAHFGHWYVDLLYLAPLLVVLGALGLSSLRDRRRGPAAPRSKPADDEAPDALRSEPADHDHDAPGAPEP